MLRLPVCRDEGSSQTVPAASRPNPRMPARHAHAAGDACSSSKPSNAGVSPAHRRMTPTRPGPARHDSAWLALIQPRGLYAPGDDDAHAIDTGSKRSVTSTARQGSISASEGASDGQHRPDQDVCRGLSRPAAQQPKTEKPIGQHPRPAASCFGGYRTPAGARFPSQLQPFSRSAQRPETGHLPCRDIFPFSHVPTTVSARKRSRPATS